MHRSKKLPRSGERGYFNEKRTVNVRVIVQHTLPRLVNRPRNAHRVQTVIVVQ